MAKTIALTALAALLVAAPAASATLTGVPLSPSLQGVVDQASATVQGTLDTQGNTVDQVTSTLQTATDAVHNLAQCRPAIQWSLDWYSGKSVDTRNGDSDFLLPHAFVTTTETRTPRYETITQTVLRAGGPLDAVLPPITQTVTRLVGFDVQKEVRTVTANLDVQASWRQDDVRWTPRHADWLLLPTVLPNVPGLRNDGPVLACSKPVLDAMPDWQDSGWICVCDQKPADGWRTSLLSLHVALAEIGQGHDSLLAVPDAVVGAAQTRASAMQATPDELAQAGALPGPEASANGPAPSSSLTSTLNVPPATGTALGALVAVALAGLGLAGRSAWRRLH